MSRHTVHPLRPLLALALLVALAAGLRAAAPSWEEQDIGQVLLLNGEEQADVRLLPYRPLIVVSRGGKYRYRDVRHSIESLNRTGLFAGIEVKVAARRDGLLDVLFILQRKPRLRALQFGGRPPLREKALRAAIYSLRRGELFEESRLPKAVDELQALLRSQGYFSAEVSPQVSLDADGLSCSVLFIIAPGRAAHIRQLQLEIDDPQLAAAVRACYPQGGPYLPGAIARGSEKARSLLKKKLYYFPEIQVREEFADPGRTAADITVSVTCGFRYHFIFQGMSRRMELISDVWERRVFEKWAEEESRSRLLNYLKNEGYLDARVDCAIRTRGADKTIAYTVAKNRRYRLGRITIRGNRAVDTAKIRAIMHADDVPFNKLVWLRLNSLVADMQVLKLYYYYQGISPIEIRLQPSFRGSRADIEITISEGRQQRMASVEFSGNRAFPSPELYRRIKSRTGAPYVPHQLSEDIDRLQGFYRDSGYDEAVVRYELSAGEEKSLLVRIDEGPRRLMGELIIVGASAIQRGLLKRLFPLARGAAFSRSRVDAFRAEAEASAIFSEVRLETIARDGETIDVLVKVVPDRSRLYGLGVGWEERRGPRGTVEYQERNLFRSIYSLAATLQAGVSERDGRLIVNERRGILSLDAPYLFRDPIATSFKVWEENETYPSYKFIRWGLGVTMVKKFSEQLYVLGSAKWYRTTLKELSIPVFAVDQLDQPFDTTALQLSFVNEGRDDPFFPHQGHFLTADLKLGLPVFEKDYTFLKLYWNYQKHYPFLRDGTFSFSVKNGIGFGDMSITERFFAGGFHSFRGTGNDRLGPINTDVNPPKGSPEGGNVLVLFNIEATFPSLLPVKDLYYTVFADVGNVFAKSSDLNLKKMERALGFGLKYRTPLGPIRLECAFNLRKAAERNFIIQWGIGNVY
jgi:outer membrane protein insertion porin family